MLVDTHCHFEDEDYQNLASIISDNLKSSVLKMVVSLCSLEDIKKYIDFDYDDIIYLTIGYHPEYASFITCDDLIFLKKMLKKSKVVGIGEIGLDYHYGKDNKDKQIWLFEEQLKIASEFNLPVVIHTRDATMDTINILKKYKIRGIIHCFSGSLEVAKEYIKMGFYLGIGGVVTFKNSKLKEVLKNISLDHIVLETDSPYLTPEPYRGKRNSSKYLKEVCLFLASLYNSSYDDIANITTKNAYSLFGFNLKDKENN